MTEQSNTIETKLDAVKKAPLPAFGLVAVGVAVGSFTAAFLYNLISPAAAAADESEVTAYLARAMPNASITGVECGVGPGVCEVHVGETILYVDHSGRYGFAGSLLDFEERVDLTARRRDELQRFAAIASGGQLDGRPVQAAGNAAPQPAAAQPRATPVFGDVDVTLPIENAVVFNGGRGLPVIHMFSDLTCPYCQRLHDELRNVEEYEIREYFVDWLGRGGGERARLVLCSDDPAEAAHEMYGGGNVALTRAREECDAEFGPIVEQNTEFARQFGMQGTPTMIHESGRRFPGGYAPAADVRAWASAS